MSYLDAPCIHGRYIPEQGPSYSSGGEPAEYWCEEGREEYDTEGCGPDCPLYSPAEEDQPILGEG